MISNNTAMDSFEVDIPAAVGVYSSTISWDIPVGILRAKWFNKVSFEGDSIRVEVAPLTTTGAVISNAYIGDYEITVSPTVLAYSEIGFYITVNGIELGRIISIDKTNSKLGFKNAFTADITAGSYTQQTIRLVPFVYLDGVDSMMVFEGGDELMIVPANAPLVVRYTNNNGTAKAYSVKIEYKY